MVHHSKDLEFMVRYNLRDGHGPIDTDVVFKADEMAGKAKVFNRMTVKPGSSIGGHVHVDDAEIYYILSGEVVVDDNGKEIVMTAGDAMFTGPGDHHSLENRSDKDAVLIAIIIA